jgi:hypothetical protein
MNRFRLLHREKRNVIVGLQTDLQRLTIQSLERRIKSYNHVIHPSLNGTDGCPAIATTRKRGKPWFFVQVVVATSTSIPLLSYSRTILRECLGLNATLVYKGKPRPRGYENTLFDSKKRVFDLRTSRFDGIRWFSKAVGFGLHRKQTGLESAIAVRQNLGSGEEAVKEWARDWEHGKTGWV